MKIKKNTFSTLVLEYFTPSIANCRKLKIQKNPKIYFPYCIGWPRRLPTWWRPTSTSRGSCLWLRPAGYFQVSTVYFSCLWHYMACGKYCIFYPHCSTILISLTTFSKVGGGEISIQYAWYLVTGHDISFVSKIEILWIFSWGI
jgi:hypothetical protein